MRIADSVSEVLRSCENRDTNASKTGRFISVLENLELCIHNRYTMLFPDGMSGTCKQIQTKWS